MTQFRPRIGLSRWDDTNERRFGAFTRAVEAAGAEAVELRDPASNLHGLDGLLVTDGIDVAPETYGAAPHPKTKHFDAARDALELSLLREAFARDLPVLAVCRGHQLLNVTLGGGLLQHIEHNAHRTHYEIEGYPSRWHEITVEPDSKLRDLLGSDLLVVNSRHHQAVTDDTLAAPLRAVARAYDGIIEAVESTEHAWVVGVQWHPERPEPGHDGFAKPSSWLFDGFVAETMKVRARA